MCSICLLLLLLVLLVGIVSIVLLLLLLLLARLQYLLSAKAASSQCSSCVVLPICRTGRQRMLQHLQPRTTAYNEQSLFSTIGVSYVTVAVMTRVDCVAIAA
jgi:hypothetical protein